MKQIFHFAVLLFVAISTSAEDERRYRCLAEQEWVEILNWEITEESLLKGLQISRDDQEAMRQAESEAIEQAILDGRMTVEEYGQYVREKPVPPTIRLAALDIIDAYKFQSPAIDREVLKIYSETMDDVVIRWGCIVVMLNNRPEKGLEMMKEYMADEERVSFEKRLLGASRLLRHGYPVGREWIEKGLAAQKKWVNRSAELMQERLEQVSAPDYVRPVIETIPPPGAGSAETNAPPSTVAMQQLQPVEKPKTGTTNIPAPLAVAGESAKYQNPAEKEPLGEPSNRWKIIVPILGILALLATAALAKAWKK